MLCSLVPNQIATAAEEQTATTSEISGNMQQITEVVQQTSRGAQTSVSASAQLSDIATEYRSAWVGISLHDAEMGMIASYPITGNIIERGGSRAFLQEMRKRLESGMTEGTFFLRPEIFLPDGSAKL